AEAGVNHNGDLRLAKKLVDAAVEAKADAVKFQTFIPERVVSDSAPKADYQIETTGAEESQLDMIRKLYLDFDDFGELYRYCEKRGILFMSTAFDTDSLSYLLSLGISRIKVPSGEVTNLPLLQAMGRAKKPIIMSTGMCEMDEIEFARRELLESGASELTILHCNTEYPTPYEDANLLAMLDIKRRFGDPVGYSDHTLGIEAPIAAVALGATVIEKHFTLDRSMIGPDHSCSLEPDELAEMVEKIRHIELALGSGIKTVSRSERKNRRIARRSIVAARFIAKGEEITEDALDVKRPGGGLSPTRWYDVIGTRAVRDFEEDEFIEL
ncbi:MAG: N-acetylneuraminate synthase, partial [Oscillospiraceae bacterium]|nr:N-acetylneuraminate synthase [Oscillospiraceae bacterium]